MSSLVQNIIRFGLILGIQLFLLRNIEIENATAVWGVSLFKPFFYLLFILMLPANFESMGNFAYLFYYWLIIDKFNYTSGIHASACLLIGLIRPTIIEFFYQTKIKDMKKNTTPSLSKMGFKNFFLYVFILLTIFIFYFYIVEFWSLKLSDILKMIIKILSCLFTTLILVFLSQVLFINTNKKIKRR